MKYFVAIIIIILLLAVITWGVFFSGLIVKKNQTKSNNSNGQSKQVTTRKIIVLETNLGNIKISLNEEAAPKTAANFEKLVSEGFYNNLTFHRVILGFVIQGGDPAGDGTGGPGYTVPAEIGLKHKRGSIAMARLPDQVNPERASSGSQFYIALQDLPQLDGQYTVFGQVVSGMDVVDKIAAVKTDANDKPLDPVIIKKAYIEN